MKLTPTQLAYLNQHLDIDYDNSIVCKRVEEICRDTSSPDLPALLKEIFSDSTVRFNQEGHEAYARIVLSLLMLYPETAEQTLAHLTKEVGVPRRPIGLLSGIINALNLLEEANCPDMEAFETRLPNVLIDFLYTGEFSDTERLYQVEISHLQMCVDCFVDKFEDDTKRSRRIRAAASVIRQASERAPSCPFGHALIESLCRAVHRAMTEQEHIKLFATLGN